MCMSCNGKLLGGKGGANKKVTFVSAVSTRPSAKTLTGGGFGKPKVTAKFSGRK